MKKSRLTGAGLFLFWGISILAASVLLGCKNEKIHLATGAKTGTYYSFGSAVSEILTEKTKIPIGLISTGGSKDNIMLINSGAADIAIAQNDIMDYAWWGKDLFNGSKITGFSAIAALYTEVCQIIANPDAGIKTIDDLRGKTVAVGDAGSGTEFNARQILEAYDITFDDIKKKNLSFVPAADALHNNEIDAFFCVAGAPTPAIMDLADNKNIVILEIDNIHAQRLTYNYPFFTHTHIPPQSYSGQDSDILTIAVKAVLIARPKLSNDVVYRLTKNLFENKSRIEAVHSKGAELSIIHAVEGISIPLHPGAEKYYREIGVIK